MQRDCHKRSIGGGTQTLEERIEELKSNGMIVAATQQSADRPSFRGGERKPGAPKRSMEERVINHMLAKLTR